MNGDRGYGLALLLGVVLLSPAVGLPAERLPPEVEAIRAEREAQRAALDRIRRKVEALREAEEAERVAQERKAQQEREARQREAQQRETERPYEKVLTEIENTRFWLQVRNGARAAWPWLLWLYGACFLLLLFAPYRLYIDFWLTHSGVQRHPLLLGGSALGLSGAGWILSQGEVSADPEMALALGILGLFFWFFLPGFLWFFLVFLHSLVVPHPMEAAFKRVLRGENLSREETANMAEALRNVQQHGIPADWRVRSHLRRLERLTQLMEKEKAFLDLMRESLLQQHRGERGK